MVDCRGAPRGRFPKKGGAKMAVGVRQAPRGRLGAPPVQCCTYFFAVRVTDRVILTAPLRARNPTKNSLLRKGTSTPKYLATTQL